MIWQVAFFLLILCIFLLFFKMLQMKDSFSEREQERRNFELQNRRASMLQKNKKEEF